MTDNISLGVNYKYVDLGLHEISKKAESYMDILSVGSTHDIDTSFHAVAARLSWKFN